MLDQKSSQIQTIDNRRDIVIPGDKEKTIDFASDHFFQTAMNAIQKKGKFCVALSGGSTPKAIFEKLSRPPYQKKLDWQKIWLFWSDERNVGPTDPDNNYRMAMDAGLKEMPIPKEQILRMEAEKDIIDKAIEYEKLIDEHAGEELFDLVMLGMGEDGHTASLFPETKALAITDKKVAANFIDKKNTWRMTLTFPCINESSKICFYVMGEAKQKMLKRILQPPPNSASLPAEQIGTEQNKALWIVDASAAEALF